MNYNVISFYRYVAIDDPVALMNQLRRYCEKNDVFGRILIGKEGINGAVCAKHNDVENFKSYIRKLFPGLTFREQVYNENAYHKLVIRVRDEICVFGNDVDLKNRGTHLKPAELKEWYENNENFMIIDARNDYEFDVGHFKNAKKLPIQNFREFDEGIAKLNPPKDKKIVLYCTGGVRCEKASAYMKEQGYKEVYQIDGGIINYVNTVGDDKWEGGLFVFDDRIVSEIGEPITKCVHCSGDEEKMINCHNIECDKLFVCCLGCQKEWKKTCSVECKQAPHQRPEKNDAKKEVVGIVENYYAKVGVALVKVVKPIVKDTEVSFEGKTTKFSQDISQMKDYDGNSIGESGENQIVTISVNGKVRKNDRVVITI